MEYTTTTNGAVTNTTSGKECLDLFQRIGNMRWEHRQHILENFEKEGWVYLMNPSDA